MYAETFGLLTSTSTTATAHKYSPFQSKIGLFCYQQYLSVVGVMEGDCTITAEQP